WIKRLADQIYVSAFPVPPACEKDYWGRFSAGRATDSRIDMTGQHIFNVVIDKREAQRKCTVRHRSHAVSAQLLGNAIEESAPSKGRGHAGGADGCHSYGNHDICAAPWKR